MSEKARRRLTPEVKEHATAPGVTLALLKTRLEPGVSTRASTALRRPLTAGRVLYDLRRKNRRLKDELAVTQTGACAKSVRTSARTPVCPAVGENVKRRSMVKRPPPCQALSAAPS